jgi:hypothetical protein
VIVDYGHNAAALDATGRMISNVWGGRPAAAVTLPGDRRDDLIIRTAEAIAAWFGRVIVYEDADKRGRAPGEMTRIITRAMRRVRPDIRCQAADSPEDALRAAVAVAAGQPVLFLYEKLATAREALAAVGARPWPPERPLPHTAPPSDPPSTKRPVPHGAPPTDPPFAKRPEPQGAPLSDSLSTKHPEPQAAPTPDPAPDRPEPDGVPLGAPGGAQAGRRVEPSAGAGTAARPGPAAVGEVPMPGPPASVSALAATAEQLVPPLTAAAEQVVPKLTSAVERLAAMAERAGPLRRADRPARWNRGHW